MKTRHFMLRMARYGPLVPARLWLCDHEPDVPENKLDRGRLSLYPRADIAGTEVDPELLFDRMMSPTDWQPGNPVSHWRYAQPVTRAEYFFQLQRLRWAEKAQPAEPGLRPRAVVEPSQLPLPDFSQEQKL